MPEHVVAADGDDSVFWMHRRDERPAAAVRTPVMAYLKEGGSEIDPLI